VLRPPKVIPYRCSLPGLGGSRAWIRTRARAHLRIRPCRAFIRKMMRSAKKRPSKGVAWARARSGEVHNLPGIAAEITTLALIRNRPWAEAATLHAAALYGALFCS